jgi:hypothetical protein
MSNDIRIVETTTEIPRYTLSPMGDISTIVFWAFIGGAMIGYTSGYALNLSGGRFYAMWSLVTGCTTLIALVVCTMTYYDLKVNQVRFDTRSERIEQPEYTPPMHYSDQNGNRHSFTKWVLTTIQLSFIAKECTEGKPLTRDMIMSANNAYKRVHGRNMLSHISRLWQGGEIQNEFRLEKLIDGSGIPTEKLLSIATPLPQLKKPVYVRP